MLPCMFRDGRGFAHDKSTIGKPTMLVGSFSFSWVQACTSTTEIDLKKFGRGSINFSPLRSLQLRKDENLSATKEAQTIPEAQQRANRLRAELEWRGVHSEVLRFYGARCAEE